MAGLGYMERQACVVREGRAGSKGRKVAEGFVGGVFRHRTSRALDPQLHTHAVVANLARRADGAYVALDATAIFAQAKTGGDLYQAELRARLTEYLGVEWGVVRNGTAEIKGVPMAVIGQFSKRRAQIVQTMDERGAHSARSAQDAALRTRPAKANVELSRLVEDWRAVAAELGLGETEVQALTAKIVQRPSPAGPELARLGAELAGSGGLTEKASTFDRRAVIEAIAEAHTYGATVARVEGLADRFLGSHHVLAVERQPAVAAPDTLRRHDGSLLVRPTGEKYTTPEMLACEAALVAGAQRRTGEGAGTADADAVGRALAGRPTLGDDQAEMVRSLTRSGDGVQVVRAPAGTGKTYALDAAREAWAGSGYASWGQRWRRGRRSSWRPRRGSSRGRSRGCSTTSTAAMGWRRTTCSSSTRRAWSRPARWPGWSRNASAAQRSWCSWGTTASSPRSTPAGRFAASPSGSGLVS